jgi:glycosyltransferase involved in cell wall biosynthesis
MKICFIANVKSVHARRWIQPLIARGDQVSILSYRPDSNPLPGAVDFVDLTKITNTPKLRFARWGWWIHSYVRRIQPDILHAHQLHGAGWLGAMANYHPYVVSGWGSDILVEPHRSSYRRFLIRIVLSRCDFLTVPSNIRLMAARGLGYPQDRVHLIPWGVDTSIFYPNPKDRQATLTRFGLPTNIPILLSPRRIAPVCNIETILDAFHDIISRNNSTHLALIRFNSVPSYLEQIENHITKLGLREKITWIPALNSPSEIAKLYRSVDVIVSIPSSEGYGATVYEAMASGTPTVISDLPVFNKDLENRIHTVKVPVNDRSKTAEAILEILRVENFRQLIINNGLQISQVNSTENRKIQVASLYDHILS